MTKRARGLRPTISCSPHGRYVDCLGYRINALCPAHARRLEGVSQRTHEFGVRIALGARIGDVLRQVVGEGVRTVAMGVALGIGLALAAGRLIAAMLYGIAPSDPVVLAVVSATLLVVAALAAVVPAWRAARVDPLTALRAE